MTFSLSLNYIRWKWAESNRRPTQFTKHIFHRLVPSLSIWENLFGHAVLRLTGPIPRSLSRHHLPGRSTPNNGGNYIVCGFLFLACRGPFLRPRGREERRRCRWRLYVTWIFREDPRAPLPAMLSSLRCRNQFTPGIFREYFL